MKGMSPAWWSIQWWFIKKFDCFKNVVIFCLYYCSLSGRPSNFHTGPDLYSNAEAREVPKIQALQKVVKKQSSQVDLFVWGFISQYRNKWKGNERLKLCVNQIKGHLKISPFPFKSLRTNYYEVFIKNYLLALFASNILGILWLSL